MRATVVSTAAEHSNVTAQVLQLVVEQFALQRLTSIQFTHLRQFFTEPRVALLNSLHVIHNLGKRAVKRVKHADKIHSESSVMLVQILSRSATLCLSVDLSC